MKLGDEAPDLLDLQRGQWGIACQAEQLGYVACVMFPGQGRQAAFVLEMGEIMRQQFGVAALPRLLAHQAASLPSVM